MIITMSYTLKSGAIAGSFRMNTEITSQKSAGFLHGLPSLLYFVRISFFSDFHWVFYFSFVLLWGGSWFTNLVVFKLANMSGRCRKFLI